MNSADYNNHGEKQATYRISHEERAGVVWGVAGAESGTRMGDLDATGPGDLLWILPSPRCVVWETRAP